MIPKTLIRIIVKHLRCQRSDRNKKEERSKLNDLIDTAGDRNI